LNFAIAVVARKPEIPHVISRKVIRSRLRPVPIRQHFALKRRLLAVALHRKLLGARFVAWRDFAELTQNPLTVF